MASSHKYIIAGILANKYFNISEVKNLEDIADMIFDREQYPAICSLIKEKKWETIKNIDMPSDGFREYLSIYNFFNQNQKQYAVTTYDIDELWQDPELLDIFSVG